MARFAFVTDEPPLPGIAGHLTVNHAIIAWLAARGHAVDVLLTRARLTAPVQDVSALVGAGAVRVTGPGIRQEGTRLRALGRARLAVAARNAVARMPTGIGRAIRRRRHGADAVLGAFPDAESAQAIARQVSAARPQAVLVDTIFRAPVLAALAPPRPPSVLIAHDLFHLRHQALSARGLTLSPAALTAQQEAALLGQADVIAAIQPEEAEAIGRLVPEARVIVCGHPVLPVPRPDGTRRERDSLVFLGSNSAHNLDGLRWFLDACWPGLRKARPGLRLDVVGSAGPALASVPQGVTVLGRVDNLPAVLHRAQLAIAPLLAGSGLKIKLLDAAAHGLRTVTTLVGVAGLAPDPSFPFVAAAPEAFGQAVDRTLDEEWDDRTALSYCTTHYGPDRVFAPLADALGVGLAEDGAG